MSNNENLDHNAIAIMHGFIHQVLVALDNCFQLRKGETLLIELLGDVTTQGKSQTEVKHVKGNLSNLDSNFWKTINNWLKQDTNEFKQLILLTTQKLSDKSVFKDFNTKNTEEKLAILTTIHKGFNNKKTQNKDIKKLLNLVMSSENQSQLESILSKMVLITEAENYDEIKSRLLDTYASDLHESKRETYLENLTGFLNHKIGQEDLKKRGIITYDEFSKKRQIITKSLASERVNFPSIQHEVTPDEKSTFLSNPQKFFKKIQDIQYDSDVGDEAIMDLLYTRRILQDEYVQRVNQDYANYEKEIKRQFKPKYRMASRNTNKENCINDSKNFYDSEIANPSSIDFANYLNTPIDFKNGFLHEMANEDDEIVWKLKVNDRANANFSL